jgi:hypothetical protein
MVCPGLSRFEPRRQLSRRCLALVGVRRRHPNSGIGRTPKRMSDSSCAGPSLPRSLLAAGAAGRPRRRAVRWPAAAAAAPRSVYARSTPGPRTPPPRASAAPPTASSTSNRSPRPSCGCCSPCPRVRRACRRSWRSRPAWDRRRGSRTPDRRSPDSWSRLAPRRSAAPA